MAQPRTTPVDQTHDRVPSTGLIIAALGVVILNVAPFLDRVSGATEGTAERTGYETDSLIPFMAHLGVGFVLAMIYAYWRADWGQHRGLSLASMAIAIAVALQCLAFIVEPMGALARGEGLEPELGIYVAVPGAVVWALGSALIAHEPEGDDQVVEYATVGSRRGVVE